MNDESLSALLDGECSPAELDAVLRELDRDPALRARFGRLSAARSALQGIPIPGLGAGFADGVMAALASEPAVPPAAPRRPTFAWRPAIGLAAAAAVGALAVLALRPDAASPPRGTPVATVTPIAAPAAATPAALDEAQAAQLRNYLMAYSHSRAQQGVGGTLGYARFAAYTDSPGQDSDR